LYDYAAQRRLIGGEWRDEEASTVTEQP